MTLFTDVGPVHPDLSAETALREGDRTIGHFFAAPPDPFGWADLGEGTSGFFVLSPSFLKLPALFCKAAMVAFLR